MSGTELILTALATGATAGTAAGVSASTTAAITDSYEGLKGLLMRKLSALGRKDTITIVEDSGTDSHEFRTQLVELLEASGAAGDEEIITAANTLLALAGASAPGGKFAGMDVHDNQGVQIGDNNTQDNTFHLEHHEHHHHPQSDAVVPRQLPAPVPYFIARDTEAAELTGLMRRAVEGGTVVISAIGGMAGIGKTALAVWWAHQVAADFPDGQLYVNLRGFGPTESSVMDPAEAVRGFLDAFDVPPERIPVGLEAQAALYRSLVADKRILIVLDNARDADQVRPLLPGAKHCLVVVTSRNQLEGLIAMEGAHPLSLDLLTDEGARELLTARLGADRLAAEPEAVDDIIAACARLPLALVIVAARAAAKPRFPLSAIATQLRQSRDRLAALSGGEAVTDMRAVFSWSYHALTPAAARMFRLLGLHPGPDTSVAAVASLVGLPPAQAQSLLDELERANLLGQHTPGRYVFHDLLRDYAVHLAHHIDSDEQRRTATHRLLDHDLHTGHAAALLLNPHRRRLNLTSPQSGVTPEPLTDHGQAMAWFTTEHSVLLAVIGYAVMNRFDRHVWQLSWTLYNYLDRNGHWHDQISVQSAALDAAGRLNDVLAQARAHRYIASAHRRLDQPDVAQVHLNRALDLYRHENDRSGLAHTHLILALVLERQSSNVEAFQQSLIAFDLYEEIDHRPGKARALNSIGWYHTLLGRHWQALEACEQGLALFEDLGDRLGQAHTWASLGYAHHHLGHYQHALTCHQAALELFQELGNRFSEADTLDWLGDTHRAIGDIRAASDAWQGALAILTDLDHADAANVRGKLTGDTDQ